MLQNQIKRFTLFELVLISLLAALGIASKPVITPLIHIISGPLFIPGGSIAGGFYMLWLVLGAGLINKKFTASLIGLIQAIMIIALGFFGNHGIVSIITYVLPGIIIDLVFYVFRNRRLNVFCFFIAGLCANIVGTILTNFVFFRLPILPLLLASSAAAFSGGIGGVLAFSIIQQLKKLKVSALDFLKYE